MLQVGQLAQFRWQGPSQPVVAQVQVFQGGQASQLRRQGPGQEMARQVQVAQAGELPQLRRQGTGQGTGALRDPAVPGQVVYVIPLTGPGARGRKCFAEFQVQALQPVELAQFRREGAAEAVVGRAQFDLGLVDGRAQGRHAPVRIEHHKRAHAGGRDRLRIDSGSPYMGGHLELHGRRLRGQEGLAEPVRVQDLQHGAVVGGRGRAPDGAQPVGQVLRRHHGDVHVAHASPRVVGVRL